MASPKLTPDQQAINNILKSKGYKTFTVIEYQKDPLAIALNQKYQSRTMELFGDSNFNVFIYLKMRHRKILASKIDIQTEGEKLAVKAILGLTNEALIEKIMCVEYDIFSFYDDEGNIIFDTSLQKKVDLWIKYCNDLDVCFRQYKYDESIWNKSSDAKRIYRNQWKDLSKQPLFQTDPDSMIHIYEKFLKDGHGLKQSVKAKADFLLSQQLPNINTFKIAKKIVETSSLLK
jgi:hypothetical protein